MIERTEYRLYPSFDYNSKASMKLQYKTYHQQSETDVWQEVWVDVPRYVKDNDNWGNLGWLLMHQAVRFGDKLTNYLSILKKHVNFNNLEYPYIEYPLDSAKEDAYEFIQSYGNINKYLLSVIDVYLEDKVEDIFEDKELTDSQKEDEVKRLADKNAHRVTYL